MTGLLYGLGRFCVRHRWAVLVVWLAAAGAITYSARTLGAHNSDNYTLPGTGTQSATEVLTKWFPSQKNGSSPIVFHASLGTLTDPARETALEESVRAIQALPTVQSAIDPLGTAGKAIGLLSADRATAYVPIVMKVAPGDITAPMADAIVRAARPAREAGIHVAIGGIIGSILSKPETAASERFGLLAAMVILALVFGSLVAMGLPIVTALFSLSIGLGSITLLSHVEQMPTVAPILATMIGLGVGIDYSLFTVTRHRDQLREGMEHRESIARATATSGGAIVFAGGTVMIAIASLGVAGVPIVTTLGWTTALVVAIAVLAATTLIPSVLSLVGGHIDSLRLPRFLRPADKDPRSGVWARWADWVGTHPWVSVAAALLVLVPLTLPIFTLTLGSPDTAATPTSNTDRQAYDLLTSGFGPGYTGPLVVAVQLSSPAQADPAFIADEARARSIARRLEGFRSLGRRIESRLAAREASLEGRGARLAAAAAPLRARKIELRGAAAALLRQEGVLQHQGASLLAEKAALEREGALLASRGKRVGALLANILTNIAIVQQKIAATSDPTELARLQARLARLQTRAGTVQAKLTDIQARGDALTRLGRRLAARGRELRRHGARLAREGANLEAAGAELAALASPLVAEKGRLRAAGTALRNRAESAKQRGRALSRRAELMVDSATQLKDDLVRQMEAAGGKKAATDPRLIGLRDALLNTPGVAKVYPVNLADSSRAAIITVVPTTDPSTESTSRLVGNIRDRVIPEATAGADAQAYVGGLTAAFDDLASTIAGALPGVIATVIALSFLLLLLAFRSIAIPIKAAIMNILSVTAAYGVLTAIFQWGWGLHLVGIGGVKHVPIMSYVPLIMFAVLFGLSMDYEVFLMSQIQEHHLLGYNDHDAVVAGLALSARVITAAALIMVAVFSSFIANDNPIVKEFGVGLSVAVALDATIVRILLVPATMTLLGSANWWLPRWLARALPRVDLEGKGYFERTRPLVAAPTVELPSR